MDEGPVDARAGALHGGELHAAGPKESLKRVGAGGDQLSLDPRDRRLGHPHAAGQLSLGQPGTAAPRSQSCRGVHSFK
jgi:hypothetical protein